MTHLRLPRRLAGASLIVLMALASPVHAQDLTREDIALQDQVLELQHQVQQLNAEVASGRHGARTAAAGQSELGGSDAAPPQASGKSNEITANLYTQVLSLQDQMRELSGRVDDLHHQQDQMQADLNKQIADLTFRVQQLEGGNGATPGALPGTAQGATQGATPGTTPAGAPATPAPAAKPAAAPATLAQAQAALARHDYKAAQAAAQAAIDHHTKTPAQARLLLARAFTGQHDYQQAALAYNQLYVKDPKGAYGQDALLGLAHSLASLKDTQAACATIDKLRLTFPTPRPDIGKSAATLGHHLACHSH